MLLLCQHVFNRCLTKHTTRYPLLNIQKTMEHHHLSWEKYGKITISMVISVISHSFCMFLPPDITRSSRPMFSASRGDSVTISTTDPLQEGDVRILRHRGFQPPPVGFLDQFFHHRLG